jgi:hypothetical protein
MAAASTTWAHGDDGVTRGLLAQRRTCYAAAMRRIHLLVAPLPFLIPALVLGACASDSAAVNLQLTVPQGILDGASADLRVIPAGNASCNAATGFIDPANPADAQEFPLNENCEPAADGRTPVLCAEITLEQDGEERVFEVLATRANEIVARGCAVVKVDQDPLDVDITVQANLPPKCCNDGAIQVGEQCDTGVPAPDFCGTPNAAPTTGSCTGVFTDDVCECDCLAREVLLSVVDPDSQPGLTNEPNTKGEIAIAFAGGTSTDIPNSLRAVYTDFMMYGAAHNSGIDINHRILASDLYPAANVQFQQQRRLKATCDGNDLNDLNGKALTQQNPAISRISDTDLAVAFLDDNATGNPAGNFNVRVIQLDKNGCAGDADTLVNANKAQSLATPAVAGGPNGTALVVWADGSGLRGRIWNEGAGNTCATCIPASADLDMGELTGLTRPRVAGNADGWVVAYTGLGTDQDVFIRTVDPAGNIGDARIVNLNAPGAQTEPDVAMLDDGRFAVTWTDGGFVLFQRFDAGGDPIDGDQDTPVTVSSAAGLSPAIAGGSDSGGFFAISWSTPDSGALWARFIGAGEERFLRNSVTGTFDDFMASHPAIVMPRSAPDIAVGGGGFVAIAFNSPNGVFVRRFPLPSALQL